MRTAVVLLFNAGAILFCMMIGAILGGYFGLIIGVMFGLQSHMGPGQVELIYFVIFYGSIATGFFAPLVLAWLSGLLGKIVKPASVSADEKES